MCKDGVRARGVKSNFSRYKTKHKMSGNVTSKNCAGRVCEDYILINKDTGLFAVADGHMAEQTPDDHGGKIAEFACKEVNKYMETCPNDPEEIKKELPALFKKINKDYKQYSISGGCTFAMAKFGVFSGLKYLLTASLGDTEIFLIGPARGDVSVRKLSTTHGPDEDFEYPRIKENGGECVYNTSDGSYLPIFHPDGTKIEYPSFRLEMNKAYEEYKATGDKDEKKMKKKLYEAKVAEYNASKDSKIVISTVRGDRGCYIEKDGKRLGVSRSFGDYSYGDCISQEPSVEIVWLVDEVEVFIATDGIVDCYKYDELAQIVAETKDDAELAAKFSEKSKSLFGKQHDDQAFVRCTFPVCP